MTRGTMKQRRNKLKTLDEATRDDLLEELSFRNLVESFRPELLRILAGERATKVFNSSNRRTMLKGHGVFLERYGYPGKEIVISPKAQLLLEDV